MIFKLLHLSFLLLMIYYIGEGLYYLYKKNYEEIPWSIGLFVFSMLGMMLSGVMI